MDNPKEKVKQTIRKHSSWVEKFGRVGYAARGFVYFLVGVLTTQAAFGVQKANDGTRGALEQVAELPFGQLLLAVVAVGLICHALWRFVQGFMDTDDKGSDAAGYATRLAFAVIGIIYLGLAFSAVKILFGIKNKGGFWAESWTAWLLSQPFGQWLVAIIGAVVIGIGLLQFYQTYSAKFRENLLLSEMSESIEKWTVYFGRFGYAARGIVFSIIGGFFIFAGWSSKAGRTRDFGDALRFVEEQSYGLYILAVLAIGLISYGIFMFLLARYRQMVSD